MENGRLVNNAFNEGTSFGFSSKEAYDAEIRTVMRELRFDAFGLYETDMPPATLAVDSAFNAISGQRYMPQTVEGTVKRKRNKPAVLNIFAGVIVLLALAAGYVNAFAKSFSLYNGLNAISLAKKITSGGTLNSVISALVILIAASTVLLTLGSLFSLRQAGLGGGMKAASVLNFCCCAGLAAAAVVSGGRLTAGNVVLALVSAITVVVTVVSKRTAYKGEEET